MVALFCATCVTLSLFPIITAICTMLCATATVLKELIACSRALNRLNSFNRLLKELLSCEPKWRWLCPPHTASSSVSVNPRSSVNACISHVLVIDTPPLPELACRTWASPEIWQRRNFNGAEDYLSRIAFFNVTLGQ